MMASAVGDRQMFPVQTKQIRTAAFTAPAPRRRPAKSGRPPDHRFEVVDRTGSIGSAGSKRKTPRVEVELGVESALDVLGAAKAVSFSLEGNVRDGQSLRTQDLDHPFGLVRQDDAILETWKKMTGKRAVRRSESATARGTRPPGRVGRNQSILVARFELW